MDFNFSIECETCPLECVKEAVEVLDFQVFMYLYFKL